MLHIQPLCCIYSFCVACVVVLSIQVCHCFEHTGDERACLADWKLLPPAVLSVPCCKCRTFLQYTDVVSFLLLQPWTSSLPPWTSRRHMEGQLWHSYPSSTVCAVLQNLCPEGAQTAVFCQEEGQCSRYERAQVHAPVTPISAVTVICNVYLPWCQILLVDRLH